MNPEDDISLLEDPVWTERYEREERIVRDAAERGLYDVHHVGSTAIPAVPGKPALDVLVVFETYEAMKTAAKELVTRGYTIETDEESAILVLEWRDNHAVFIKMHTLADHEKIANQLIFREYLCDHGDAREEYEMAKREAVADHADDPLAYTEAKSSVVQSLLTRAREAGYEERLPDYLAEEME